jgi:hypothetical protein
MNLKTVVGPESVFRVREHEQTTLYGFEPSMKENQSTKRTDQVSLRSQLYFNGKMSLKYSAIV